MRSPSDKLLKTNITKVLRSVADLWPAVVFLSVPFCFHMKWWCRCRCHCQRGKVSSEWGWSLPSAENPSSWMFFSCKVDFDPSVHLLSGYADGRLEDWGRGDSTQELDPEVQKCPDRSGVQAPPLHLPLESRHAGKLRTQRQKHESCVCESNSELCFFILHSFFFTDEVLIAYYPFKKCHCFADGAVLKIRKHRLEQSIQRSSLQQKFWQSPSKTLHSPSEGVSCDLILYK